MASDLRTLKGMDVSTKTDLYIVGRIGYCPRCQREFIKRRAWKKGKCPRCGLPLGRHDSAYAHAYLRESGQRKYVPLAAATIGAIVRALRLRLGLTVQQLASRIGLSARTVYIVERDEPVRADTLRRIFRLARKHANTADIATYLEERLRAANEARARL